MHPNRRFAVLVLAIAAVIVLVITSPWSSDEDHSKGALLASVDEMLAEGDAPPELRKCFVDALDENLSDEDVQSAYDAMPEGGDGGDLGADDLPPELRAAVSRYGLFCLQKLMRTGKYEPADITRMLQGFRG